MPERIFFVSTGAVLRKSAKADSQFCDGCLRSVSRHHHGFRCTIHGVFIWVISWCKISTNEVGQCVVVCRMHNALFGTCFGVTREVTDTNVTWATMLLSIMDTRRHITFTFTIHVNLIGIHEIIYDVAISEGFSAL